MAEGGSDENKNPFSFRNYMQKKSSKKGGISEDSNDDELRASNENVFVARSSTNRQADENPFSFRRFLNSHTGSRVSGGGSNTQPALSPLKTLDLANDLPDFVQDHTGASASNFELSGSARRDIPFASVILPDFARDVDSITENHHSNGEIPNQRSPHSVYQRYDNFSNLADVGAVDSRHQNNSSSNSPVTVNGVLDIAEAASVMISDNNLHANAHICELPDFLPIGALNSHSLDIDEDFDRYSSSVSELRTIIQQLQEENELLQNQLTEARQNSAMELRSQNQLLQEELAALRRKEQEDTQTLENMIKQVEANLTTATNRAVKAEKTILKLQEELKAAQIHTRQLEHENELLSGGENMLKPLKEKATYASQQISHAASNADDLLRQLLKGVDSLKIVADVLASIDKVTTADEDVPSKDKDERRDNS